MAKAKGLMLVEGATDKSFYEEICCSLNLRVTVSVSPPRDVGGLHNSKQGVIKHLPVLLNQLADGQIERLALIVDADRVEHGSGAEKTIALVSDVVEEFGFQSTPKRLRTGGLLFSHTDGLSDLGLWVMPNNNDEGALEDWILQSVHPDECALLDSARNSVASLAPQKFVPIRKSKAELATWLAWQDRPGEGAYYAVKGALLNDAAPLYIGLREWLARVF